VKYRRNTWIIDQEKQIIMDKKLIQQFGTDILCYRIRAARQKVRMQYEDFDKQLIRLNKEYIELRHRRNNLGWEPLIPPVQKGWKRFFVLRKDVAVSRHAEFFEGILKKINTYDWSYRKNFLVKRRKGGRKFYVTKPQKLRQFYEWEFKRQNFDDKERQYFDMVYVYHRSHLQPTVKYVFREPWLFVLQVRPNIIDKVKIRDHELEARIQKIEDYIERNSYGGRRDKLVYGGTCRCCNDWDEREDERNPLKNKPLTRILDELRWNDTSHA